MFDIGTIFPYEDMITLLKCTVCEKVKSFNKKDRGLHFVRISKIFRQIAENIQTRLKV